MRQERVIQVFVGSPGDVSEERRAAFEVIEAVNGDVLLSQGWRFEGVGWDQTHYPKLAWLAPQEAINQGIPQPGDCDLAVFMFWKRVGTPLPHGRFERNGAGPEPTGSLWEFHDAMESNKRPWVLVYRCDRDPVMSEDDRTDPAGFNEQLAAVDAFFAEFQDGQDRYVADYRRYQTTADFREHLEKDLKYFIKNLTDAPGEGGGRPAQVAAPEKRAVVMRAYDRLTRVLGRLSRPTPHQLTVDGTPVEERLRHYYRDYVAIAEYVAEHPEDIVGTYEAIWEHGGESRTFISDTQVFENVVSAFFVRYAIESGDLQER